MLNLSIVSCVQLENFRHPKFSGTRNFPGARMGGQLLKLSSKAKVISSIQIILNSTMGGTTICKVQLTFSCILTGYETKQKCDLLNSATRDTLRPRLYGEKFSWVEGSPAYPSYPGRANFSYISLQNLANRLHEKQKVASARRVTLLPGTTFLHINGTLFLYCTLRK